MHPSFSRASERGFSLLELLLVLAILVILAGIGLGFYGNYKRNLEIPIAAESAAAKLNEARGYALYGTDFKRWGVHAANPDAGLDADKPFLEIYSCNNASCGYGSGEVAIKEKIYLSSFVTFTTPAAGATCEIIFKINTGKRDSGTTCLNSALVLQLRGASATRTVSVSLEGTISVQ